MILRRIGLAGLLLMMIAPGCAMQPAWPEPEKMALRASGLSLENALELRMEAGPVNVADDGDPNILSLAQAMELTLRHSPAIQAALWRVREAQAEAKQARLLPNPMLRVMIRWPEGGGSPMVEAGIAAELLSLLKKPGQISTADHQLRAASAAAVVVVLDELAQIQAGYAQAQALDARTPILQEQLKLLDQMVTLAQSRLEAGEGTRVDVTTLMAQRVELQIELAQQQLAQRDARLALARLTGRPSADANWSLDDWQWPQTDAMDESPWLQAAMEHRPELLAAQAQLQAMGAQVKLSKLGWIGDNETGVSAERADGNWSLGPELAVMLPLFDWGQARREISQVQRITAMHEYLATQRLIIQDVRQAHAAHVSSRQVLDQLESQLIPLLERRQEETALAYRAGQSDALAIILAQNDLQAARMKQIELRQAAAISFIRLTRAIGGPGRVPSTTSAPINANH